jgi:hypothetical protein
VLRYRLYDLDRIVSRTLSYGLLTLLLGGGYAAVVLGLGQLLGRDSSSLVVAAAPSGGCGRSHNDAIVGCTVWSTTASSSALSASRSTCSRSRAAKASTVRAAS